MWIFTANFNCDDKPVMIVKGDSLNINLRVNFRHFSPFLKCDGVEMNEFKLEHNLQYTKEENLEALIGTLTAKLSISSVNEALKNVNCRLYYNSDEYVYYQKEIEHMFLLPPFGNIDFKQPEFYYPEDQEKLKCSYKFFVHCEFSSKSILIC